MPELKNARHELFAQQLAMGKPAAEAYRLAGFRDNDGNAIRLKGNERVQARVLEIQAPALRRAEVTVERLAEELGHISLHDLSDVLETRGSKVFLRKKLGDLPKSVTAAISSIRSTKDGIEVKFHDKLGAINLLGKHKGMFKENINLTADQTLADLVMASFGIEKPKAKDEPKDKA